MQLYTKITIGLLIGLFLGLSINSLGLADTPSWTGLFLPFFESIGSAFTRGILMMVVPLVVASLIVGVASLDDGRSLGRLGGKTVAYFLTTTCIAITIGVALSLLIEPGTGISAESRVELAAHYGDEAEKRLGQASHAPTLTQTLVNLIPRNPVAAMANGNLLPLIFFVILFGAAVAHLPYERRKPIVAFFEGINDASLQIIHWIMVTAPYAVFAMVAAVTSRVGMDVLQAIGVYALVVVLGLLLHATLTHSLLLQLFTKRNPLQFFRAIREAQLIAFSTSSSSATLPVTIEVAQENLGISRRTSSFILPMGATINMDGTALYQGVATLFIAQVYGIDLGITALLTIIVTATLASIGAAGVPGTGLVILVLVLNSVGLGEQAAVGIALILGVDRFLDMVRTSVNVTGDLACATVVAHTEGEPLTLAGREAVTPIKAREPAG